MLLFTKKNTVNDASLCLQKFFVPKRFDFIAMVCAHQYDLIAVTETFLDQSINDAHIILTDYNLFRREHGGGVMLAVRNSIYL